MGRDGYRVGADNFGDDFDAFLETAMDRVIYQAEQLTHPLKRLVDAFDGTTEETVLFADAVFGLSEAVQTNPVTQAIEDFKEATSGTAATAMGAYMAQRDAVMEMAVGFDGSLQSMAELREAFENNKASAYQFALAIKQIGESIRESSQNGRSVCSQHGTGRGTGAAAA